MATFEPGPLIERLVDAGVEFVIVGGFAVIAHGYVRATRDLDIVPASTRGNYERLAGLLRGLDAEQIGVDANLFPTSRRTRRDSGRAGAFSSQQRSVGWTSCRRAMTCRHTRGLRAAR
jgi:hypothetical protein